MTKKIVQLVSLILLSSMSAMASEDRPQRALMWTLSKTQLDIPLIKSLGADIVWLNGAEDSLATYAEKLERAGITCMPNYKVLNNPDWATRVPEWGPRFFLPSKPVTAKTVKLTMPLLDGYGESVRIEASTFYLGYWKVWDRTTGAAVSADAWRYVDGVLTVQGAVVGHDYNAAFSAYDTKEAIALDMYAPASQQMVLDEYQRLMSVDRSSLFRPTQFAFYFHHRKLPSGMFLDWYGPGGILGRPFIERYEQKYGKRFDIDCLFDAGDLRSTNDEFHAGYRELLNVQREVATDFAPCFTEAFHKNDRQVRMFWGDSWVGLEPTLPRFDALGFDQIVGAISVPQDVRRLMTVSPKVRRNLRFGFWGVKPGDGIKTFERDWNAFLRGALRDFPEGMTVGGPSVVPLLSKEPGYREYVKARFTDFEKLYGWIHAEKAHVNKVRVGVLNSWGSSRAWPREFTMNDSQKIWRGLTDLPIAVEWLSFAEVAENGIPAGIDVLLNVGEPGSSWAGGDEWTSSVVKTVEQFVAAGGGFIGVDGCGVTSSGFALENLLGLKYNGLASPAAKAKLFNTKDRSRRFAAKKTDKTSGVLTLATEARPIGKCTINTRFIVGENTKRLDDASSELVFTRHSLGKGSAWYISGVPATELGFDFVKRLLYEAAGKADERKQLDCSTVGGFVYYYPERQILLAYNQEVASGELELHLDALGLTAKCRPLSDHVSGFNYSGAPVSVSLPQGSFGAWTVTAKPKEAR